MGNHIYLTPVQQLALPTIKWLMNHDGTCLATGRTTVIAYALLESAYENPGLPILLWDHSGSYDSKRHMMDRVRIVEKYINNPEYELEYNKTNMSFRAIPRSLPNDGKKV